MNAPLAAGLNPTETELLLESDLQVDVSCATSQKVAGNSFFVILSEM